MQQTESEPKGYCRDCLFIKQEYLVFEKRGQLVAEQDWCCEMCDVFKRLDGYCDFWEPK
jgi:hypothetical protein